MNSATPGQPRPRTRGARRREQTPDAAAFPLLSSRPATVGGWIPPKGSARSQQLTHLEDPRDEDRGRVHADALRSRLQATGFKRSIVQAQLFPDASNQREAADSARPVQSLAMEPARTATAGRVRLHADNNADNHPLAPPLYSTGGALIPSRPTTSTVSRTNGRRAAPVAPQSARELSTSSKLSDAKPQKVPMTARDQYYVEKRATTAPSSSQLHGGKRRPLRPSNKSSTSSDHPHEPSVSLPHRPGEAARGEEQESRHEPNGESSELPTRRELLARTGDFKTLTESIAEQMRQRETTQRGGGGGSVEPTEFRDPIGGAAVPRDSFLYLRRVDSNPYNLALTTHARIDPNDYYTVSRLGVTHFAHQSSEFTTMEKFERENYLYSLIVKLPFFKRYRQWKRFGLWKHAVNSRKRAEATVALTQNLFVLLPHLHDALVRLRQGCIDLQRIHLFAFDQESAAAPPAAGGEAPLQKTFTLTEFSTRLKAQKMECERLVDQFLAQSGIVAKQACEQFLYDFLQGTGFNVPSAQESVGKLSRRASQCATPKAEARRKSILAALPKFDPDLKMTYTERATMRTQCRRVTQFLRVVEFFLSDALLQLAISSAERLRHEMAAIKRSVGVDRSAATSVHPSGALGSQVRPNCPPLFRVEVSLPSATPPLLGAIAAGSSRAGASNARVVRRNSGFLTLTPSKPPSPAREPRAAASDQLTFSPSAELLRTQVETLLFNGLKAVTNRERLLCNAMFKVYVETSKDDGLGAGDDDGGGDGSGGSELASESMDLDILIMEDAAFVETLRGINALLLDAYELAEAACRVLAPFLDTHRANVAFCKSLADPQRLVDADADEFRDLLSKYTKEIRVVDALPDASACGLLLLDTLKLNAVLKPSPRSCLERLQILIPVVVRQKNESFMLELSASNERVSSIPSSVDEFAATLAYLHELQAGADDLDDRYAVLKSLYALVEEFGIKLTDADQMNAFLVSQKRAQLRTSMELFENSCEQYTTKFGIELEARIPGLAARLSNISKTLAHASLFQLESDPRDVIAYLATVAADLAGLEAAAAKHFYYEQTLALPQTTAFEDMGDVKVDLELKTDLWRARHAWDSSVLQWEQLVFPGQVDVAGVAEQVQDAYAQLLRWEKRLSPGMHVLCAHLKARVDEYRVTMPILADLECATFETRHFAELQTLLGFSINARELDRLKGPPLTLGRLVAMQLAPFGPQIGRIATEATQERMLKETLDKVVALWEHMAFEVRAYKDAKDAYVLVAYENLYASLEESLISMTAILSSKYLAPINDAATTWQKRLAVFQETLDAWLECQRKWMHLESIFAAPDIQKQLPAEAALFAGVHQFWKDLMRRARDQKLCLKVSGAIFAGGSGSATSAGAGHAVLDTMLKHNASLERIEKSLEDYLETKRAFFPRFYFISNDELLEILAHAKEPQSVQRHLCKCFDALVKLELSGGGAAGAGGGADASHAAPSSVATSTPDIVAMISPEGERVALARSLKARGNVEDWLNAVLATMRATLHRSIKSCLLDYQHGAREAWIFRHPAQAVAVASYMIWARECEVCFRSASQDPLRELKLWHQTICVQLGNLTRLVRTALSRLQRSLVVSLVTTDVHFRDVVDDLVANKVTSADNFAWAQQLRYYWHAERDDCEVLQANCRLTYGYEYMGACSRLVITPLTDRCWMTITGALELRFGAAPSGPAGTGKTETSKDLAKALGILCIVFNCSDQIDYKMVGKICNGVVQAGCWTCLDEFNRIDVEVLSVVAQQMHVLRHARLRGASSVHFEGKVVPLREHHVIITMNPGYVGRTELPDNLKVCFRPVAMMVPDYAQIAEILLFAEGFQSALVLSRKVTKLFKLCSEQLSQQPHYDFGMRSVKAVLTVAGTLKRAATAATALASHLDESVLLLRAMHDANVPKFVDDDIVLFRGILRDLFPETLSSASLDVAAADGFFGSATAGVANWVASLDDEVGHQLAAHGLQPPPKWRKKVLELFTTLDVRVGVVQTGASGSGKSTAARVLKEALTTLRDAKAHPNSKFQRVVSFVLNPKAISMAELYGFFHPTTREWTDGLASSILRACIAEKSEQLLAAAAHSAGGDGADAPGDGGPYYWVTFDGPIDVLWIESMNTVLDDNRTLCLANGERIKLLQHIHLLFEVLDTASASPATISRLGVVYYHPSHLGWRPYVETWVASLAVPVASASKDSAAGERHMARLNATHKARVLAYFDAFVDAGFAFLRSSGNSKAGSSSPAAGAAGVSTAKVPIATSDLTFVTSICHLFQSLLLFRVPAQLFAPASAASLSGGGSNATAAAAAVAALEQQQLRCLDLLFVFSYAWSFGGNLHVDAFRKPFQDLVLRQVLAHEQLLSQDLLAIDGRIPTPRGVTQVTDNVHDFFVDFALLSFSPWETLVPRAVAYRPDLPLAQVLVPTTDVVRYAYLAELLVLDAKKPVLLTGATGSGKSMIARHLLASRTREGTAATAHDGAPELLLGAAAESRRVLPIQLQFSAQTSSAVTQLSLESKLAKKRKTLLGAPPGTDAVVIVIDDVNLPTAERLGAQPPLELLRQFLELKGLYDRDKFFWKDVADTVVLAAGGLPGGGRHALCPRLVRHFAAVWCLPSSDDAATRAIFQAILAAHAAALPKSARDALLQLVDVTCQLYAAVARELLPTPAKCHYLFNLRDVAKLMQGVVLGTQRFCGAAAAVSSPALTAERVVRLWAHESVRVFRDRLVDEKDRLLFSEQLVALANGCLGCAWSLESVYQVERETRHRSSIEPTTFAPLLFGVTSAPGGGSGLVYEEIDDLVTYEDALDAGLVRYNERQRAEVPQLVFFRDAIVHVAAISRILVQPRGHALLLGMCGSGKRSLTRLSAFLLGYRCCEVAGRTPYGSPEFRDDLKAVMVAAVLGKRDGDGGNTSKSSRAAAVGGAASGDAGAGGSAPTVLLLNDAQLVSDDVLDDVNALLSGGEIPKLFSLEEREKVLADVRLLLSATSSAPAPPVVRRRGTAVNTHGLGLERAASTSPSADPSREACEAFFLAQVHELVHVVVCLSPAGDAFRARVRHFPSLVHCTTIAFFDEWPRAALQYVAERFLSRPAGVALAHPTRAALGVACVEVHRSAGVAAAEFLAACQRRVVIAPPHFLGLLALFQRLLAETRGRLETKLQRLTAGVVKLEDTHAVVNTLQDELVALQPVLVDKAAEAERLLQRVSEDQAEASRAAARVAADEREVKQQQQEVAACQADAQSDLELALPALDAAVAALDALDKKDIAEVKGFVKPPQAVQVVMEAVCLMLGEKPDWDTSKRVLSRGSLLAELKDYDKDAIPPHVLKRVRRYVESPEFAVDEVKKVSRAATSLCMWVHAVDTYARVHREVAPKRHRLAELNTVLAAANAKLAAKQLELAKGLASARALEDACAATLAEKQRLVDEAELTKARLQRAERLTAGLSDERVRWKRSIEQLKDDGRAAIGNAFLAAASLAYLGPFDGLFRAKIVGRWAPLVAAGSLLEASRAFALEDVVGDAVELREWKLLGLPSDAVSAANALCIRKSDERWPLLIDPQQQASRWIKRLEAPSGLCVAKSCDLAATRVLESCLSGGRPLLVEDFPETLEPTLEPVLRRGAMFATATTPVAVPLGERVVDVEPRRFRLYMATKLANPAFAPDVFLRTNVINFTVTRDGLEDQLLSAVARQERPEVEARRNKLLASIAQDQKLLQQLETKLLGLLSDASGNLLDDLELIQALETSKQTALVVTRRLAESEATKREVLEIRGQYAPVAARGALLYFVVADLARLDPMYQYSLEYFARLFNSSLDAAPQSPELETRLESLGAHLTLVVYRNICRGLFEAHKLLFSLLVCLRLQVMRGELTALDVALLDASSVALDTATESAQPHQSGAAEWDAADVLIALASKRGAPFELLLESYRREPSAWDAWVASSDPYATSLPGGCDARLALFHRLVLVRWLRADAFVAAARCYISEHLGARFVAAESLAMAEVFDDMDKATPCLFVLSSGADPTSVLDRFAREKGFDGAKSHTISLGQGQGPVAEALMERCIADGHWLALLNVHLAKSWLPRLQLQLAAVRGEKRSEVHEDFRLFLASFPATYFPIAVLQSSVKVICEPPKGVQANLRRSIALLVHADEPPAGEQDEDEAWVAKVQRQLAFGLSVFHAVIQERAKFGTLGWNLSYDFSDADLLSVLALQRRLLHGAQRAVSRRAKLARHGSMLFDPEPSDEPAKEAAGSSQRQRVPWDALHFLTAEIYYGGRVTDEFDRRCLLANLRRFCSPATLEMAGYVASEGPADASAQLFPLGDDQFCCPEFESHADMAAFVDALSAMDAPSVFGMHPNAHIHFQKQEAQRLVADLVRLHPTAGAERDAGASAASEAGSSASADTSEQEVVAMAQEMQRKLPVPRPLHGAASAESGLVDPLRVVLHQELAKCHALLQYVHERLDAVQKAVRGVVVMSRCLEDVVQSLSSHQVPLEWRRKDGTATVSAFTAFTTGATSPPLSHWVKQLLFRYGFLHRWLADGAPPSNVFPLSVFSFPQGFFTALLQRHARKLLVPIHHLEFRFEVAPRDAAAAIGGVDRDDDDDAGDGDGGEGGGSQETDGALISGMFLEGARWDEEKRRLCDPEPGVMHHVMPIIHVVPQAIGAASSQAAAPSSPSSPPSMTTSASTAAAGASRARGSLLPPSRAASALKSARDIAHSSSSQLRSTRETAKQPSSVARGDGSSPTAHATRSPALYKYSCPVYKTPARKGALSTTGISTNFVLAIDLPCERPPEHYTLNGTALVCNTTD